MVIDDTTDIIHAIKVSAQRLADRADRMEKETPSDEQEIATLRRLVQRLTHLADHPHELMTIRDHT